jgi:hypothetical protein
MLVIILLILAMLACKFIIAENVYAAPPSFVRQVVEDVENDVVPILGDEDGLVETAYNNFFVPYLDHATRCMVEDDGINPLDIRSISYLSDGKALNGTIWLTQPVYSLSNDTFKESLKWVHMSILNTSSINNNLSALADKTISELETHFDYVETNNSTLVANTYPAYRVIYGSIFSEPPLDYVTFLTIRSNIGYLITYQAPSQQFQESLPIIEEKIINSSDIFDSFYTYQDGKSGISINYPIDWDWFPGEVDPFHSFSSVLGSTYNKSINFFPAESITYFDPYLSLTIEDLPSENISLKDYAMENDRRLAESGRDTVNSTFVNLAGNVPVYKIEYRFKDSGLEYNGLVAIIKNKDKIYYFFFEEEKTKYQHYFPAMEKIIESFQILPLYQQSPLQNLEDDPTRIKYLDDWEREYIEGINPTGHLFSNISLSDISFRSPLTAVKDVMPWQDMKFSMLISTDSAFGESSSYYYDIDWNNTSLAWDKQFQERGLGPSEWGFYKTLFEAHNSTDFFSEYKNYINFDLDLKYMNYPETFKVLFYTHNYYIKDGRFCKTSDISDWGLVPPPQLNITASPASLDMKPGDEKDMTLSIRSNTAENHFLDFLHRNTDFDLSVTLPPSREVPISGETVTTLKINASEDAQAGSRHFPIYIDATFPSEATAVALNETFINPTNTILSKEFRLTVNVLPPEFNITTSQSSLDLRPGDEKDIIVQITSDADIGPPVRFKAENPAPNSILVSFLPNVTYMDPLGTTTSTMHIEVLENATAKPYSFHIVGHIEGYNATRTDFTLTVLPPLTPEEKWQNQMQNLADFLSPVNSIWTFITAIGAVMVPLVLRRFSKKHERNKKKDKKIDDYSDLQ